ncbi:MAG TPA: vanadium-dependent haloperoxidase, partial [Propionibacteriaceae bacterium]|nr:vanadium-dependent haloperoxidase [Propionibacteriaceae bacterium]
GRAKVRGLRLGTAAAQAVLETRVGDGSDTPMMLENHPQGTKPGQWRFTPDRPFAFAPGWADVRLFALKGTAGLRVEPPYRVGSAAYARDLAEVKAFGSDGVSAPSARTADQTEAARFWVESSPLQWNRIAREVAERGGWDPWTSARLFALLNMSLADGYVASFSVKYGDPFWRPVTAIRGAATDGNPATTADRDWIPLDVTPPIPDHDSAHAVQGAAAATVMAEIFGTDRVRFDTCSLTLPDGQQCDDTNPTLRSYRGFWQAAQENANSRVWVGYHFRHATEVGLDHGQRIARLVMDGQLKPVR